MSRDEIIRMAREACDPGTVDAWKNGFWTLTQEELERFAALVAEAERKAILRHATPAHDVDGHCDIVIAADIIARGEK